MPYNQLGSTILQEIIKNSEKKDKNAQLGKVMRFIRLKNSLTQKQMANILQMPYQNYQRYEYGIYKPKPERLGKFCDIFRIEQALLVKEFYI